MEILATKLNSSFILDLGEQVRLPDEVDLVEKVLTCIALSVQMCPSVFYPPLRLGRLLRDFLEHLSERGRYLVRWTLTRLVATSPFWYGRLLVSSVGEGLSSLQLPPPRVFGSD